MASKDGSAEDKDPEQGLDHEETNAAAKTIQVRTIKKVWATSARSILILARLQRNYRGYRSRREMNGCGMSAAGRWREVLKDGEYLLPAPCHV